MLPHLRASSPAVPRQKLLPLPTVNRTVVLLGKTGCGKSLLGNVMLGEYDAFKSVDSTSSVTKGFEGKEALVARDHRKMDLIVHDTQGPGLIFVDGLEA